MKDIIPEFPRTMHLPWKVNSSKADLVASEKDCEILFNSRHIRVDEKIDGANCGMVLYDGHPIIRNKDHILRKGYYKNTPAKQQFKSVWNWFYEHKENFEKLNTIGKFSVYGDWMYAQHGLEYDLLPSLFMCYDLFDYEKEKWLDSHLAKKILNDCNFSTVTEIHVGVIENWEQLEKFANSPSQFTTKGNREGIYVKTIDGKWISKRFKMVREGFVQGGLWSKKEIKKNKVV